MPALDFSEIEAVRVAALSSVLDTAQVSEPMIRIAPDEALFIGDSAPESIAVSDPSAIIEADNGWSGAWLGIAAFLQLCAHTIDWQLPTARPTVAQGLIAGVPAKVWMRSDDDDVLLFVQTALVHELIERLG